MDAVKIMAKVRARVCVQRVCAEVCVLVQPRARCGCYGSFDARHGQPVAVRLPSRLRRSPATAHHLVSRPMQDYIRTKNYKNKFYKMRTQLQGVALRIQVRACGSLCRSP